MGSEHLDDPGVMEVTGRVLIATIIALVILLILVFLFHIYAKWLWHRRQQQVDNNNNNNRRSQQQSGVTVLRRGLDAAFLKTLPVLQFDSKDFKDGLECSVCLSELEQGEKTRILPKCNHVFHAECIDMWFHSHSTCPICRNPVSDQTPPISVLENQEAPNINGDLFPTNVLFWGDESQVSTLTSQLPPNIDASSSSSQTNNDRWKPDLVIDIPRLQASEEEEDDERTPIMRSLRRILSGSRRFNPFSPAANNISES